MVTVPIYPHFPPANRKVFSVARTTSIVLLISGAVLGTLPACGQATKELNSPDSALAYLQTLSNRFEAANAEYRGESKLPENYESLSDEQQIKISQEVSLWAKGVWDRMEDSVTQADQIVPQMVAQMLATGSLDDVMIRYPSNETFRWVAGNPALSSEERQRIEQDLASPRVFFSAVYNEFPLDDGRNLYAFDMYHTTGIPEEDLGHVVAKASSFVVRRTPEEVVLHRIDMNERPNDLGIGVFAGFILEDEGEWPALMYLNGPEGSGHFLRIYHAAYDATVDALRFNRYDEHYSPVSRYQFDPKTGNIHLTYSTKYGGGGEYTVDSSEMLGNGNPLPSSKGVYFAAGSGKPIDPAEAGITISASYQAILAGEATQALGLPEALQRVRTVIADGVQSSREIVASPDSPGSAAQNNVRRLEGLADLYHSMSGPIYDAVVKGFEAGIPLEGIQRLTVPYLTWSNWPDRIGLGSAYRPTGFDNNAANEIPDDSRREQVVLIYREHGVSADLQLTYLQTSYCFPKVNDRFLWRSGDMAVIVRSAGEVRLTRLEYPLGGDWVVSKAYGSFPLLLGFLQLPERRMPLILVGQAPSGTQRNCSVYAYIWADENNEWQCFKLESFHNVTDLFFDADSSTILKFSGWARDQQGNVTVPILETKIDLPAFLRKHKDYVKQQTGIDLLD